MRFALKAADWCVVLHLEARFWDFCPGTAPGPKMWDNVNKKLKISLFYGLWGRPWTEISKSGFEVQNYPPDRIFYRKPHQNRSSRLGWVRGERYGDVRTYVRNTHTFCNFCRFGFQMVWNEKVPKIFSKFERQWTAGRWGGNIRPL